MELSSWKLIGYQSGIVWVAKNHLKTVPIGRHILGVSWSRNVYIP